MSYIGIFSFNLKYISFSIKIIVFKILNLYDNVFFNIKKKQNKK